MDEQNTKIIIEQLCRENGVDDNSREHGWSIQLRQRNEFLKALRDGKLKVVPA
jgi:hypothetical protein